MIANKIKVLIFSNITIASDGFKGSGSWINALIAGLKKNSELTLKVAFHDRNVKIVTYENFEDIQLIRIPTHYNKNTITKFLSNWLIVDKYQNATRNYIEVINKIEPDIIQIFGLESPLR